MNIPLFFNGHSEEALVAYSKVSGLSQWVAFHHKKHRPNWKKAQIAIFSVSEYRGEPERPIEDELEIDPVRAFLYSLKPISKQCEIIDLGSLRLGHYTEETHLRLAEVCETLVNHDTLPVIIGGTHDLDYGQFMAYQNMDKLISVLQVDSRLDLGAVRRTSRGNTIEGEKELPMVTSDNHLRQILVHHPNYLFDCNHLGHQRFFNELSDLEALRALSFDVQSLGEVRTQLSEAEPLIRMADMLSFDISAIKKSDAIGQLNPSPFGFTGEEACQICWYAGVNEKLSSFGVYGYRPSLDLEGDTASVIAIMLWYFLEGVVHRQKEYSFNSNFHIKYTVEMPQNAPLVFYKSKLSEKWWIEIGNATADVQEDSLERPLIIPCSYKDYEQACSGDIPERWIKAQARPEVS